MLHVLGKLPRELVVAVSGGPDSMAILDFLNNNHKVTAYYFDHGTTFGEEAYHFLKEYCARNKITFVTSVLSSSRPKGKSLEEFWRDERYKRFHDYNLPIVTGHNLDDVVEWFLFSSLHGKGKIIPYQNKNVIRPFLATPKRSLLDWCERKKVPFLVDPGNDDRKFMRSVIRHDVMPHAKVINPGIEKTFKKIVESEYNNN
jgi:tRNA(Ile)-lysidine synthase